MVLETEPREYVDWRLFELLKKAKREGTLAKKQFTQPLWLTARQAKELGYNQGESDFLLQPSQPEGRALFGKIPTPTIETISEEEIPQPRPQPAFPPAPEFKLGGDFGLLYQEYRRAGGNLDVVSWGAAGAPLRPEMAVTPNEQDLGRFLNDLVKAGQGRDAEQILRLGGLTEQQIDETVGVDTRQRELEDLIRQVFPSVQLEEVIQMVETEPDTFLDKIRTGGRTQAKQDLLRLSGFSEADLEQIFAVQKIVAPVSGVRKLITWDSSNNYAYDEQGKFLGSYNPITKEISPQTFGEKVRDFADAFRLASAGAWLRTKGAVLTLLPKIIFRDMTPLERKIQGKEWADETDRRNKELRDTWRVQYAQEQRSYEDWVGKHSELKPRADYEEGAGKHPELWKDPGWYAYEFASMAPVTLTALGVGALATVTTGGNLLAGMAAAYAVMTPVEMMGLKEELLANGVPEDQVDEIAIAGGALIGLLESAGRFPLIRSVAPAVTRLFTKEVGKEMAKVTMRQMAKKGLYTFTANQFSETATEVLQEIVGNAALKVAGADVRLLEGVAEVGVKTFAGTLPFSLLGGVLLWCGLVLHRRKA